MTQNSLQSPPQRDSSFSENIDRQQPQDGVERIKKPLPILPADAQFKNNMEEIITKMKQNEESRKKMMEKRKSLEEDLVKEQEKKSAAEKDNKKFQARFYERTKNIRVTDDDFSTIVAKLGKFSGKLSNFPPNSKSAFRTNLRNVELAGFFVTEIKNIKDEEKIVIDELFNKEDGLDYSLVSVLVEKLVIAELVDDILDAPIHLNPIINKAYKNIEELFDKSNHESWSKNLRLKLSRATLDAINKYPDADKLNDNKRNELIQVISSKLGKIYDQPEEIKTRVEKLVDMAIELSLPIRGQDDLLKIYKLKPKDKIYKNQVRPVYRQFDKDEIYLGITPVFLANSVIDEEYNYEGEESVTSYIENYTLVYQGKAIW